MDILRDLALHQDDGEKKTVQCPVYGYIKTREMQKAERKQIGTIQVGRTEKGIYYFTAFDGYHGKVMFPLTFERDIEVIMLIQVNLLTLAGNLVVICYLG